MIRKAFVMSVHAGQEAEYERRHRPIWPELEKVLKDHGVHNYSIFLHAETRQLFAYAEIEDEAHWYFRVLSHTTPMAASSVTFVIPAFGMLWGALALGEPVGIGLVAGFGLVSVSLVLVLGLPLPSVSALRTRGLALTGRPAPA